MRFKGMIKDISSGRNRTAKIELDNSVSLDAVENFKDQICWIELSLVTPENDVTEVLIDATGEVVG